MCINQYFIVCNLTPYSLRAPPSRLLCFKEAKETIKRYSNPFLKVVIDRIHLFRTSRKDSRRETN